MWSPLPKVEKYQFTIFQVNGKHIVILPILKFWITVLALIPGICIMPSSWFHEGRRANKKNMGFEHQEWWFNQFNQQNEGFDAILT